MRMVRTRCLWRAADGRCACCKAKRMRLDVLKIKDYEVCVPEKDYETCDFFKERPDVPEAKRVAESSYRNNSSDILRQDGDH
jgi:hypothetical protein